MSYSVRFTERSRKQLKDLDKPTRLLILKWVEKHLENCDDPFAFGHALTGDLSGFWRYRIGDYRLISKIDKGELIILVVEAGHRSKIYK